MIFITISELQSNLDYYLEKSQEEDVIITDNGKKISVLTNPQLVALLDTKRMINNIEIDKTITLSDEDIILEEINNH